MRPQKLVLEAFGPYLERTELDLTQFDGTDLFLITGPTGGGKTSLLDAMSFALYCRATGGRRSFSSMRCISADEEAPTIVQFDFSLNGETYRFRRTRSLYRKRGTGVLDAKETHECFIKQDGKFTLLESGSERAVREKAEELLHLSCEQFSQVIVLPQGEFLRLLRANSQEKGEILRTLFSAEVWQLVNERFRERARALDAEGKRLEAMKKSLLLQEQVETTDALRELAAQREKALNSFKAESEKLSKELRETEELLKSAEKWELLSSNKIEAQKQYEEAAKRESELSEKLPENEEKKKLAESLREKSVTVAQESTRLSEQREQLLKAENAKKQADATRTEVGKKEKELADLREKTEKLSGGIKLEESNVKKCSEAAQALPRVLEVRSQVEKKLELFEEFDRREKTLAAAKVSLNTAKEERDKKHAVASALSAQLEQQESILRQNAAVQLAHTLKENTPCPVCGATHHPNIAHGEEQTLNQEELNTLRAAERGARESELKAVAELETAKLTLEKAQTALNEQAELLLDENRDTLSTELEKIKEREKELKESSSQLEAAQEKLKRLTDEKAQCAESENALRESLSALRAKTEELDRRAEEAQSENKGLKLSDVENLIFTKQAEYKKLTEDAERLTKESNDFSLSLERAREAAALKSEALKKASKETEKFEAPWEQPPEIEALREKVDAMRDKSSQHTEKLGEQSNSLKSLKEVLAGVGGLDGELKKIEDSYGRVAKLSQSLSGKNIKNTPILQYVLSVMLDEVLVSANNFFTKLSRGRYALRLMDTPKSGRAFSGLDLEVLDGSSMLPRSIETLSGGEQFLASLSLAFGLSEVVQNHSGAVQLDSIFIDEGFGSLDPDTLDAAMKALALLQSSGRLIGIISHVSELKNRISARIEVKNDAQGFAAAKIHTE